MNLVKSISEITKKKNDDTNNKWGISLTCNGSDLLLYPWQQAVGCKDSMSDKKQNSPSPHLSEDSWAPLPR